VKKEKRRVLPPLLLSREASPACRLPGTWPVDGKKFLGIELDFFHYGN
jgi:hypothetical protein